MYRYRVLCLSYPKKPSVNLPNSVHVRAYACIYTYIYISNYMHMPVLFVFVQLNGNIAAAVDLVPGKYMYVYKKSLACV